MEPSCVMSKQDLLMSPLQDFFYQTHNIEQIKNILEGTSLISLRIIDWFVTNYSKKNNTCYLLPTDIEEEVPKQFIVYLNYKSQLKAYSKKQFDPFCRKNRIVFYYGPQDTDSIKTTVGQLNFFRWAIKYKVLEYIEEHLNIIESDMNQCIRKIYGKYVTKSKQSIKKERRKRKEISISATKTLNKHNVKIVLNFN